MYAELTVGEKLELHRKLETRMVVASRLLFRRTLGRGASIDASLSVMSLTIMRWSMVVSRKMLRN